MLTNAHAHLCNLAGNYLGGHSDNLDAEWNTSSCADTFANGEAPSSIAATVRPIVAGSQVPGCVPTDTNLCMSLDVFAGESGYYNFAGINGPSPDITVKIGETYTFDQTDPSNWYHAVGK